MRGNDDPATARPASTKSARGGASKNYDGDSLILSDFFTRPRDALASGLGRLLASIATLHQIRRGEDSDMRSGSWKLGIFGIALALLFIFAAFRPSYAAPLTITTPVFSLGDVAISGDPLTIAAAVWAGGSVAINRAALTLPAAGSAARDITMTAHVTAALG